MTPAPQPQAVSCYCPRCVSVQEAIPGSPCRDCGTRLKPVFDSDGALTRDYLEARQYCCESGCRNCPYGGSEK